MRDTIKIYSGGTLLHTVTRAMSSRYRATLDGELSLSFSTLLPRAASVAIGCTVEYDGQYYTAVKVSKSISGGLVAVSVDCEHISYALSDVELESFSQIGTPEAVLTILLSGTSFSVGTVEPTASIDVYLPYTISKREILVQIAALSGSEPEYDGTTINLRTHRGSTVRAELCGGRNLERIGVSTDSRANTTAYELDFYKPPEIAVGDDVSITFPPLNIDVETRVVSLEYDVFNRRHISVGVGDYAPDLLRYVRETRSQTRTARRKAEKAQKTADDALTAAGTAQSAAEAADDTAGSAAQAAADALEAAQAAATAASAAQEALAHFMVDEDGKVWYDDVELTNTDADTFAARFTTDEDGNLLFDGEPISGGGGNLWVQPEYPTNAQNDHVWVDTDDYSRYDSMSVSADKTLIVSDPEIINCTASDDITVTLHDASAGGVVKKVVNNGSAAVTLRGNFSAGTVGAFTANVDGVEVRMMRVYPGESVDLVTDGTGWNLA